MHITNAMLSHNQPRFPFQLNTPIGPHQMQILARPLIGADHQQHHLLQPNGHIRHHMLPGSIIQKFQQNDVSFYFPDFGNFEKLNLFSLKNMSQNEHVSLNNQIQNPGKSSFRKESGFIFNSA
jgi:hypothetical protein